MSPLGTKGLPGQPEDDDQISDNPDGGYRQGVHQTNLDTLLQYKETKNDVQTLDP